MSRESSVPSKTSVSGVLNCISDEKRLSLFKNVALSKDDCSGIIIGKLGLTRKQFYSNMERLMHTGLVKRVSGKYSLTSLGKIAFGVLVKMETATKYYWNLKAIDSIITFKNTELPTRERQKIIDTLIDNQEIKIYL